MNWPDYIVADNEVLLGKPTIKGTRLSVEHIVSLLAQGWTEEQILKSYPRLTPESLKAVFAFLLEYVKDGIFIPPVTT